MRFTMKPKSFGDQVTMATKAVVEKEVGQSKQTEVLIENILTPETTLTEAVTACAAALGGKALLWPGVDVPEIKRRFDKAWVKMVGEPT